MELTKMTPPPPPSSSSSDQTPSPTLSHSSPKKPSTYKNLKYSPPKKGGYTVNQLSHTHTRSTQIRSIFSQEQLFDNNPIRTDLQSYLKSSFENVVTTEPTKYDTTTTYQQQRHQLQVPKPFSLDRLGTSLDDEEDDNYEKTKTLSLPKAEVEESSVKERLLSSPSYSHKHAIQIIPHQSPPSGQLSHNVDDKNSKTYCDCLFNCFECLFVLL